MRSSARLTRAVAAERADLERERTRLLREGSELRAALAQIELALAEIDERRALLDRLAPPKAPSQPEPTATTALSGPAIREVAVAALVKAGGTAMHYRDWYDLVTSDGHEIAGKDPLAVFLTQLSRSPAIRKGTSPGVYELDYEAPQRFQAELDALRTELRSTELTAVADLTTRIGRAERALREAEKLLATRRQAA
jgi:hypothetical protein